MNMRKTAGKAKDKAVNYRLTLWYISFIVTVILILQVAAFFEGAN